MGLLDRLLKRYAPGGPGLVIGPAVGIDSAVIDFHGHYLIAKTDPITFVAEGIGSYALYINANDIAVMGGVPRWFLSTILLPEDGSTVKTVQRIFSEISRACRSLGVTLAGGHTEITRGIEIPIVVGQMLGTVDRGYFVTAAGARPGDDVMLTKGIAVEATSILARNTGAGLIRSGRFAKAFISRCVNFTKRPGISVVRDAGLMLDCARVHAMHDPTEGGLATGLHELALASGCGLLLDKGSIYVYPETERLLGHYGLDPMGAIASGALIAVIDPADTEKALHGLSKAGIRASRIGVVTRKKDGAAVRVAAGPTFGPVKCVSRKRRPAVAC